MGACKQTRLDKYKCTDVLVGSNFSHFPEVYFGLRVHIMHVHKNNAFEPVSQVGKGLLIKIFIPAFVIITITEQRSQEIQKSHPVIPVPLK